MQLTILRELNFVVFRQIRKNLFPWKIKLNSFFENNIIQASHTTNGLKTIQNL